MPPTATNRTIPLGMITIYYPGYDASHALDNPDLIEIADLRMARNVPLALAEPPRDPYELTDWARDNDIEIISATRAGTAPAGRKWRGRYNLIIGASRETLEWIATRRC